jgi:hypothetical protein
MSDITPPEILLREMREISFALTRTTWSSALPFQLYAVLVGDTDSIGGKALPAPVLAHIDALGKYSDDAGGWLTTEDAASLVGFDAWEAQYAAWRAQTPST